LLLCLLLGGCRFFEDDTGMPNKLPIQSMAYNVTLTSNGCCLWTEDITVSLVDALGNKTVIAEINSLNGYDIVRRAIPSKIDFTPIRLEVALTLRYVDPYVFSFEVLEFSDITALRKTGVLVYVQEADGAYVNVVAGDRHVSYKLNKADQSYKWDKLDEPKRIYP